MAKLLHFVWYLLLALAAAGAFGAVHDQISYSVSPEYYTKFKFIQFGLLDASVPERVRASQVGFLGSWWMGVPLGLLCGVAGFIHPTPAQMRRALLWSLLVVAGFILCFELAGLAYGFSQTTVVDLAAYQGWYVPPGLEHPRRFLCVGYMHNSAYLGGALAVPVSWLFHITFKRRASRAPRGAQPAAEGTRHQRDG